MANEDIKNVNGISDEEFLEAYTFILEHDNGELSKLETITPNIPNYFSKLGFISFGIDALSIKRFQTTAFGKQYARLACAILQSKIEEKQFAELFV